MKKNKGFTLIELLAVVVILGVLLLIAVPSVSEYISNSRKSTYIRSAEGYIDGVRQMITSREISAKRKDVTFYVPIECIGSEQGGKSPYGEWERAYVVVTYADSKYEYYWTSFDSANMGIKLTHESLLDEDLIEESINNIDTTISVGSRSKIMRYEIVGDVDETEEAINCELAKDGSGNFIEITPSRYIEDLKSLYE